MNSAKRGRPVAIDTSLVECIVVAVPDTRSVASVAAAFAGGTGCQLPPRHFDHFVRFDMGPQLHAVRITHRLHIIEVGL